MGSGWLKGLNFVRVQNRVCVRIRLRIEISVSLSSGAQVRVQVSSMHQGQWMG